MAVWPMVGAYACACLMRIAQVRATSVVCACRKLGQIAVLRFRIMPASRVVFGAVP